MSAPDWRSLDGIPLDGDEPVFDEPWQAQAFAMAVALNERDVFGWLQWAEALGSKIADAPETPYWLHWVAALEEMLAGQSIADSTAIEHRTQQWHEAAARTPHGEPIKLEN